MMKSMRTPHAVGILLLRHVVYRFNRNHHSSKKFTFTPNDAMALQETNSNPFKLMRGQRIFYLYSISFSPLAGMLLRK